MEKLKCWCSYTIINTICCLFNFTLIHSYCLFNFSLIHLTCLLKLQFIFLFINWFFSLYPKECSRPLFCLCPIALGHARFTKATSLFCTHIILSVLHNTTTLLDYVFWKCMIIHFKRIVYCSKQKCPPSIAYQIGSLLFKIYI